MGRTRAPPGIVATKVSGGVPLRAQEAAADQEMQQVMVLDLAEEPVQVDWVKVRVSVE